MPSVPVLTPVTVKCPPFQTHLVFTHPVTLPVTQFTLHNLPITLPIVTSRSHTISQPASSLPAASSLPGASKPAASSLPGASKPAASQLTLLEDIWAGKIGGRIWSKIGPYKLFSMDLERLRPGEELESEVINAYLACLAKRYTGHAFVIDSFEMTKMWNGKACLMKRTDLKKYGLLLGSVNEAHHWTLLLIYPHQGRIVYMNSLGEGSKKLVHCCKAVRDFMDHKGFRGTTWKCLKLPHSLQTDGNSCGVFVCKFAEAILTGGNLNFPCGPDNIAVMRKDIGQRLLNESEDLSDLCLACGNEYPYTEDKLDTWIECDSCSGWYHWDCMSRPSIEAVFICPGCQGPL
ncbi:hypothetical protein G5714_016505 [Onychostoma macrolepis]|uniref:Ubiquitin-like protease family profile domain-containing protein n=2 Tax=Onychostoma macrolepis TaxID=369639 RepID=A0A7J6CCT1_9TELE|nr:hypothetical protein G5714_016505 [Onychostoma macrolepis]